MGDFVLPLAVFLDVFWNSTIDDFAFGYFQEAAKGGTLLDSLTICVHLA